MLNTAGNRELQLLLEASGAEPVNISDHFVPEVVLYQHAPEYSKLSHLKTEVRNMGRKLTDANRLSQMPIGCH